jgi:hypothetical protein
MAVDSPDLAGEASEPIPPAPSEPPPLAAAAMVPATHPVPAPPAPPRRRLNLLWYTSILVALVVVLGGFGLLFIDDQSWQRSAARLQHDNSSLQDQLTTSQAAASDAQGQVKQLQQQLQHPSLGIWNVPQKIDGPDTWLEGGIPDTFTYHLRATATGPMSVSILTFEQYATAVQCVDTGQSDANHCMHPSGAVMNWINVRSVSYDFHLAEGCAGYLGVWTAPGPVTVQPDVSVTYNPAPTFTGVC